MNKKHAGSSFLKDVKQWKKSPGFRQIIEEHKEKAKMAFLIKKIRLKESLSQSDLAKKAKVTQSVIARIESNNSDTMPRIDLLIKILSAMGYKLILDAKKVKKAA
jgi:ribosome-binding protein aMBF1 (putative translation factor)